MKQTNKALRWHFDPLKNFRRKAPAEIVIHLLVTLIFMPDQKILFGVLNLLGLSMLAMAALAKPFSFINP